MNFSSTPQDNLSDFWPDTSIDDSFSHFTFQPFKPTPSMSAKYFLILVSFDREIINDLRDKKVIIDLTEDTATIESINTLSKFDQSTSEIIKRVQSIQATSLDIFPTRREVDVECFKATQEIRDYLHSKYSWIIHHNTLLACLKYYSKQKNVSVKGTFNKSHISYLISTSNNVNLFEVRSHLNERFESLKRTRLCLQANKKWSNKPDRMVGYETVEKILQAFKRNAIFMDFEMRYNENMACWEVIYEISTFLDESFLDRVVKYFEELYPPPEKDFTIILNYFQYKYYNNFLRCKHMEGTPLDRVKVTLRKPERRFDLEEISKISTKFATILITGPYRESQQAYDFLQAELRNLRTKLVEIPYHVSYQTLEPCIVSFLAPFGKRMVNSLCNVKYEIQLSKIIPYNQAIDHNYVKLYLIYDRNVSTQTLIEAENRMRNMMDRLTELRLEMPLEELKEILNKKNIRLDTYFEKRNALIVSARKLDTKVIIAGMREEIQDFKRLIVDKERDDKKIRSLLVNTGNDLICEEIVRRPGLLEKLSYKYEGGRITSAGSDTLRLEANKIQDIQTMKAELNKLIQKIEGQLFTVEEEISKKFWDVLKPKSAEEILKKYLVQLREIQVKRVVINNKKKNVPVAKTIQPEDVQWYWKCRDSYIPFCSEHNKIIEEAYKNKEELILDSTIVEKGATKIFNFETCEITDVIKNRVNVMVYLPTKNTIYEHYGEEVPKKIPDEITQLVLNHKEVTKENIIQVFAGDFTVLHTENILANSQTREVHELRRGTINSPPDLNIEDNKEEEEKDEIKSVEDERVIIEIKGIKKRIDAFMAEAKCREPAKPLPKAEEQKSPDILEEINLLDIQDTSPSENSPEASPNSNESSGSTTSSITFNSHEFNLLDTSSNPIQLRLESPEPTPTQEETKTERFLSPATSDIKAMLRITSEISNTDELEMINFNDISKTSGTHFDEGEVKLDESIRISGYVARTHCLAIKQKARELGIEIKLDKQAKKIYYNFEQDFTGEFKRYVYELEYLRLLPEGWEGGVYGDFNFKAFPLDIYSAEYNKVLDMFEKSMLFCYNESSLRIKKIQNYCLIRLWLEKSLEYQQEFNQEPEIKLLFYGSTKQNPNEIAQNSIVSFPKTLFEHGQYGNGLYFAEKAVDVAGSAYQIGDSVGTKSILLAAVMLGNYTRFDRVNLVNDDVQYQAIKGNSKSGDVYVLFEENMAYPLYVIEYNETI